MTRSPSPSFGATQRKKSYSPQPSPAPFLTPNPFDNPQKPQGFSFASSASRPLPRRLLSLQSSSSSSSSSSQRVTPYSIPSPISPISPISSPSLPSKPKRPTISHRSHSFCASSSNATYALASAPSSGHLSPDKRVLVAPPLERTLSSIGQKGNTSPPTQQMQRPLGMGMGIENISLQRTPTRTNSSLRGGILSEKDVNSQSPPSIPTIYVHPSLTPPRPSLSTRQQDESSRSSSFASSASTAILTPTTPHDLLFKNHRLAKDDGEDDEEEIQDEVQGDNDLTQGVDHLMIQQ
ncbi:hypothetical protein V866_005603 [Kwoniella sp. B9012]